MIEKKEGQINEFIYCQTIYNNASNAIYPTIMNLKYIIKKLCEMNCTTEYIKFNPFYKNAQLNCQIEFDDYMFYMECRDSFTMKDMEDHWAQCMDNVYDNAHEVEQYATMDDDKKRMARILYPICKSGDYEAFHNHLKNYENFLDELIPFLFSKVIKKLDLSEENIAFGYFCFEVHSS